MYCQYLAVRLDTALPQELLGTGSNPSRIKVSRTQFRHYVLLYVRLCSHPLLKKNRTPFIPYPGSGLFQHGTNNIILKDSILADNREAARNFHHEWAVYDGVEIIGRSEHVQSMIDQGRLAASCSQAGGISIQPNEGLGVSVAIENGLCNHLFVD